MTRRRSTPRKSGDGDGEVQRTNPSPRRRVKKAKPRLPVLRGWLAYATLLICMALLSLLLSLMVLNQTLWGDPDAWLLNKNKSSITSQSQSSDRGSWIDRLLRKKLSVSSMGSHSNVDDVAISTPFDWELRGGRGSVAIFYNVFMPPPPEEANALGIIEEQIGAIGQSPVSSEPLTLYYNLIGNTKEFNQTKMAALCHKHSPNLDCRLLQTYESASESVTLQAMLDFCHGHQNHRVTYLHTKGAFHASDKNTHWRRLLTKAALHPDCIRPPDDKCNVCGLQFFTQFTFFVPGNMFSAHCSYVEKLLPMDLFRQRQEQWVNEMLYLKLQNLMRSSIIPDQMDYFGIDRYADEHWIGSHPDVIPCDLDPFSDIARVFNGTLKSSQFEWKRAPRTSGVVGGIGDDYQAIVRNNTDLRRREILLLPGLLQRWRQLYLQIPRAKSWIWTFFPDAEFWQSAIDQHGEGEAVSKVTAKYRTTVDGMPLLSGFQPLKNNEEVREALSLENDNDDLNTTFSHVVFYHIMLPSADEASLDRVTNLIGEQLTLVSLSSTASVRLWYTLAGSQTYQPTMRQIVQSYCDKHSHIKCRFLGAFNDAYEGESLRLLHRYCTLSPEGRVSYIHTMPPPQLRMKGNNDDLVYSLTKAALSKDCVNSVQDNKCNVCGLIFYNLWTHFFPGNMFTADCNYVRKLDAPQLFEIRMNQFIRALLMMKLRNIVVTNMFPTSPDTLGLARHSLEYWIASHPELIPCDLSTEGLSFWSKQRHNEFHWGLAPRHIEEAPFGVKFPRNVFAHDSQRLREYSLLPGHILRWNFFYGKTPEPFSWQWFAAPDGLKWLSAIHKFGNRSVLALTAEYAKDVY